MNELKLIIPERAVLISTEPGDIVLDPFGGGGSTFQAAEANPRNWIGVELFDCEHIKDRLIDNFSSAVGEQASSDLASLWNPIENKKLQVI